MQETLAAITSLDAEAMAEAEQRQSRLTKPRGSLGALEELLTRLCGIAGTCPAPVPAPATVAVFAADHGVHAQGVSPWPQEVTTQMVGNLLAGGAAVNVLARQVGADVVVVDVGVATELDPAPGLLLRKVRAGTRDLSQGPAMSRGEVLAAVAVGIDVARGLVRAGSRCLLTGDMGIANTTASAALVAAFTGSPADEVTGRGTGIDDPTLQHKTGVVREAVAAVPEGADPVDVLARLGGLEHAALAGFVIGAAASRVPVILDGVVAGAATLAVRQLCPSAVDYCVAGHRSVEPGHRIALAALGLRPLLDLDLRLGEGTGAVLALPLVQSSARILAEMATFDSAGVTEKAVTRQKG